MSIFNSRSFSLPLTSSLTLVRGRRGDVIRFMKRPVLVYSPLRLSCLYPQTSPLPPPPQVLPRLTGVGDFFTIPGLRPSGSSNRHPSHSSLLRTGQSRALTILPLSSPPVSIIPQRTLELFDLRGGGMGPIIDPLPQFNEPTK